MNEVSNHKVNMLLVNKADLLSREQRRAWARYFQKQGLRAVFWSALAEGNRLDAEEKVRRSGRQLLFSFILDARIIHLVTWWQVLSVYNLIY